MPGDGLIPAHAGTTTTSSSAFSPTRAYPHSRGENHPSHQATATRMGSSPLTRGKQQPWRKGRRRFRFIPTHAGKTSPTRPGGRALRAHPHSRGENELIAFATSSLVGSSPLTRGKLLAWRVARRHGGLIPTHAGKTGFPDCRRHGLRAHPHSRGENEMSDQVRAVAAGSSPLTRGKLQRVAVVVDPFGLIPTHAGKTLCTSLSSALSRAHPHSRGENCIVSKTNADLAGSSPLTRGKLAVVLGAAHAGGLIPTHAGKTGRTSAPARPSPAHPHSRGENVALHPTVGWRKGSSPLTRGKRSRRCEWC